MWKCYLCYYQADCFECVIGNVQMLLVKPEARLVPVCRDQRGMLVVSVGRAAPRNSYRRAGQAYCDGAAGVLDGQHNFSENWPVPIVVLGRSHHAENDGKVATRSLLQAGYGCGRHESGANTMFFGG